jgi:hypothetical protein
MVGRLIDLRQNIRLGWAGLPRTNTNLFCHKTNASYEPMDFSKNLELVKLVICSDLNRQILNNVVNPNGDKRSSLLLYNKRFYNSGLNCH